MSLYRIMALRTPELIMEGFFSSIQFLLFVGVPLVFMRVIGRPPWERTRLSLVVLYLWPATWVILGYLNINTTLDAGPKEFVLVGSMAAWVLLLPIISRIYLRLRGFFDKVIEAPFRVVELLANKVTVPLVVLILVCGMFAPYLVKDKEGIGGDEKPNVIILLVDALRSHNLGAYGYERDTSPWLDEWSKDAILFERAYSPESYTMASVPSLFTSVYPNVHQVLYDQPVISTLSERYVTMAEVLTNAGYQSAAFVFNPHLQKRYNFDQGFELYDDNTPYPEQPPGMSDAEYWETGEKIKQKVLDWLDREYEEGRPYFLYLHYRDVHSPYLPPRPYSSLFIDEEATMERVSTGRTDLSGEDREYLMAHYDAEIRYCDEKIEKLLSILQKRGLLNNTIIVFTSDHGEAFYEQHPDDSPWYWHGRRLYEEEVSIPLIIQDPRLSNHNTRISQPVSLVDVFPTIVEMTGIGYEGAFQGVSLLPLMAGSETFERGPVTAGGNHGRGMIVDGNLKYYARLPDPELEGRFHMPLLTPGLVEEDQLFSLKNDPAEKTDLSEEMSFEAESMREKLEKWYNGGSEFRFRSSGKATEVDKATRERLKALGYVQ